MATVTDLEIEAEVSTIEQPYELYEVVADEMVEEPHLGALEIWIASRIVRAMILFDASGQLGSVWEEALFTLVQTPQLRRRPDVAFVSTERWPVGRRAPREAAWDVIPDMAIEIVSPTDKIAELMSKLEEYFAAGVRRVWVVYPDLRQVYAYDSTASVQILAVGDSLDGSVVLPGFVLPLADLFETGEDEPSPVA